MSEIIRVSSNEGSRCPLCSTFLDGSGDFTKAVNHLITVHQCEVRHIGTETVGDDKGQPWHTTVAILSK